MLAQSVNHVTLDTSPSPTKSEWDSANTKPYKHTQTLALRKARVIVRFWKGWWSDNPSGSRPNLFRRQHLTFDKGRAWMPEVERPEFRKDAKPTERSYGKWDGAKQGMVRVWEVMRGEGVCDNNIKSGHSISP